MMVVTPDSGIFSGVLDQIALGVKTAIFDMVLKSFIVQWTVKGTIVVTAVCLVWYLFVSIRGSLVIRAERLRKLNPSAGSRN